MSATKRYLKATEDAQQMVDEGMDAPPRPVTYERAERLAMSYGYTIREVKNPPLYQVFDHKDERVLGGDLGITITDIHEVFEGAIQREAARRATQERDAAQ